MKKIIYLFLFFIPMFGTAQTTTFSPGIIQELLNDVEINLKKSNNVEFADIFKGVVSVGFLDTIYKKDYGSVSRLIIPTKQRDRGIHASFMEDYIINDAGSRLFFLPVITVDFKRSYQLVSEDLLVTMIARYKIDSLLPIIFMVKRYNDSICSDILVLYYDNKKRAIVGPSDQEDFCN